jgi:hypothetical protein
MLYIKQLGITRATVLSAGDINMDFAELARMFLGSLMGIVAITPLLHGSPLVACVIYTGASPPEPGRVASNIAQNKPAAESACLLSIESSE